MSQEKTNVVRIRTGVKALIVHEGKVLIIAENVEKNGENQVIYDFPGGGIDLGEPLEQALKREVYEEVGLKIAVGGVVGAWDFILDAHHDVAKAKVQIVCIGYQCSVVGDPTISLENNPAQEDIFKYMWLTKEEILNQGLELLEYPAMLQAVRNLD